MKTFGDHLRQAREAKGVTIDSIADATRISRRYLQALERSDLDGLPGGAFDKGYIKTYAELLEIDSGPLLAAYDDEAKRRGRGTEESERQMLEEMAKLVDRGAARKRRRSSPAMLLVLAAFVLAAGALWLTFRTKPTESEPEAEDPAVVRKLERSSEPVPSPEPEPEAPKASHDLRVTQSGVGTQIVNRSLEGRGTHFAEGTKLWYWTRVVGGGEGARIRHVWIHEGRTGMLAELPVEGAHWRTYSTFTLPAGSTGEWVVEARTAEGEVLARDAFVCLSARDET